MNLFLFPAIIALGWIGAFIHLLAAKPPLSRKSVFEILLLYQLVFSVGINSLLGFYGHAFLSNEIAEYIGWLPGSPFQLEVAYTNLTFGILGLFCIWFRNLFWVATVFGLSIWYWANAYGHIKDWLINQNTAPGNIGFPLYVDIVLPIVLVCLLIGYVYPSSHHQTPPS